MLFNATRNKPTSYTEVEITPVSLKHSLKQRLKAFERKRSSGAPGKAESDF